MQKTTRIQINEIFSAQNCDLNNGSKHNVGSNAIGLHKQTTRLNKYEKIVQNLV